MKKILITGATGYIGNRLLFAAIEKGYHVNALVRNAGAASLPKLDAVTYLAGDIRDFHSVCRAMEGCREVIHAAGIAQLWQRDRRMLYEVNVGGTRNVLEAALQHEVERFVFTSSCAVIGPSGDRPVSETDPRLTPFENDYERSKYCAEELVREYVNKGLQAVIISPSRVYGPGLLTISNPLTLLIRNALCRKIAFVPSAKNVVGNYAFIDDVVQAHFKALCFGTPGEKYIAGGENLTYNQFFNAIRSGAANKVRLITVPKAILKAAGAFAYAASLISGKHYHLTPRLVERLYCNRALSCDKAIQQIGYTITPAQEGISKTIQFLKQQHHV